ncbi:hypothetical protein FA09DRAFT_298716 [Tilletiopsis washingtonensis]|uniref:C2H2-type domain-containing protein n=1 Tax=Tilletiopsis washingtonensis TaxID=58919 RepID=A0A316Z6R7_9BASI|nr:hypothetical protein FA09DRAFT_298716 [Tilletiopsis washingtonensis]PWN97299.1 hypothetical protein FA09DRAFT_298716 [Tilletiopsis washingtonensis]
MVPVATVTTSATQAASASRRTNAAVHYCPIPGCNSSFTRKFNLNGHLRSHTGDKPFECGECGKKFARRLTRILRHFDLSRHERLHSGIKAHTCETCGKNFARIDALRRHLRTDGGNGVGCAARAGSTAAGGSSPGEGSDAAPSPNGRFVGAAM